ncbi:MAG TPA: CHAD domain-containing protein [Solirubrobacteraceae bacterium]|nr:CHAD domain-containing protein [Solirubrobacteraceae bacterium]
MAATVALARAERERRAASVRRARDRRFALLAGERMGEGLRRMALAQLDVAIEALEGRDAKMSPQKRVHEARKALKRLRALLRLVRDELGERAYARESELVRSTAKRLAQARDAEVLLSTLDDLIKRHAKKLGGRRGVQRLRARLQTECDGAAELALADSATRAGVLDDLRALRVRVSGWQLAEPGGIEAVEAALQRLYGTGRRRMGRAERAKRGSGRKLHEWRKRVKDLRYAAEMLQRGADDAKRPRKVTRGKPGKPGKRTDKGKRTRRRRSREAAFIGKVARRADDLAELLGEEHDLAVLAERVRKEAKATRASGAPGPGTRKALLKLIARRRKRLRRRALREGRRLFARSPRSFVRRVRAAAALESISRR